MRFTQAEFDAALVAARKAVDATGYGRWVSDEKLSSVVDQALKAIEELKTVAETSSKK